jgi:hypothetical protein
MNYFRFRKYDRLRYSTIFRRWLAEQADRLGQTPKQVFDTYLVGQRLGMADVEKLGSGRTGQLRLISTNNRYPNRNLANASGAEQSNAGIFDHYVGSGDVDGIVLLAVNSYVWLNSLEKPANSMSIRRIYIAMNGIVKQFKWGGATTSTVTAANTADPLSGFKISDVMLPSEFGLSEFVVGTPFQIRHEISVPAGGTFCVLEGWGGTRGGGHTYATGTVNCTTLDGTGDLFYDGAVNQAPQSWTPIVLGTFVSGDPAVGIDHGDSIANGVGDTRRLGLGYPEKGRINNDRATAIAGLNVSRPSGSGFDWTNIPQLVMLAKYANYMFNQMGTNSFSAAANVDLSAVNYTANLSINTYKALKANQAVGDGLKPFKVIQGELLPRLKNPPTGDGLNQQAPYTVQWDVGGNVDQFHNILATSAAVDKVMIHDDLTRADTVRGNTNFYLSKAALTLLPDGTHPSEAQVIPLYGRYRQTVDGLWAA